MTNNIIQNRTTNNVSTHIGIDISKERIDIYILEDRRYEGFPNDEEGLNDMIGLVKRYESPFVVLESTGGWERKCIDYLLSRGIRFSLENPRKIRNFAKALGSLAKTDRLDAKVIALYCAAINPRGYNISEEAQQRVKVLVSRRNQLIYMLSQEKNRRSYNIDPFITSSIDKHIEYLKWEISKLDKEIDEVIEASEVLKEKVKIIRSMPGCGKISSHTIIGLLPELGKVSNKSISLLVGVAPISYDSGKYRGRRYISGGRRNVRSILYMVALSAIRTNAVMSKFYKSLIGRGKPKKVAITACMRKILITLNAMMRNNSLYELRNTPITCS